MPLTHQHTLTYRSTVAEAAADRLGDEQVTLEEAGNRGEERVRLRRDKEERVPDENIRCGERESETYR